MKYYIFLKGVNVGGNSKVGMTALKNEIKKAKGVEAISSYLNSGNLIVETGLDQKTIIATVGKSVENLFSPAPAIFARTDKQLAGLLENNPFSGKKNIDKSHLLVYFLSEHVDPGAFGSLSKKPGIDEEFHGNRDHIYVYYKNGIARSKLTANYIDKTLNVLSTGRNLNTIEAVLGK